jgi:hypothetical protein
MAYNGIAPQVDLVDKEYFTGIKLNKTEMAEYENKIVRLDGLEKWFVDIAGNTNFSGDFLTDLFL